MQKSLIELNELKLVGITERINTARLFESDSSTNPIAATVQKYFHNALYENIQNRKNSGTTFCVYTNYESDFTGNYTYFIGEEVTSVGELNGEFESLIIPTQTYIKFTDGPGPMPAVCINMWQAIWGMEKSANLGEVRAYIADFEVYDERSRDHQNVTLDIYVGVET